MINFILEHRVLIGWIMLTADFIYLIIYLIYTTDLDKFYKSDRQWLDNQW